MTRTPFEKSWWVADGKLLGGEYPGGLDPDVARVRLANLLEAGITSIVNLQEATETSGSGKTFADYMPIVRELSSSQNMPVTFRRMPIRDQGVPEAGQMTEILGYIDSEIAQGRRVYIHCWGGNGRTGTVAGCWLVRHGRTPAEAIREMARGRAGKPFVNSAPENAHQRAFVEAWQIYESAPARAALAAQRPEDRAQAALIGLAIGDAVGTTVEFTKPGSFTPVSDMVGGGPFGLAPGQWTDDTSMALCLAESLLERKTFEPIDQLKRYVRWWQEGHLSATGRCFDIGNQTRTALSEFTESGRSRNGPSGEAAAGNGSLMRIAPIAIAYWREPARAIELAAESSMTTHPNVECLGACRYFTGLLVGAITGRSKKELLQPMFSPVDGLWDRQPLPPRVAKVASGSFLTKQPPDIRGTGYVIDCLEAALWAFASTNNFEEAILAAVNLGDDADTTGAVCGQIAGAYYGLNGLPARWRQKLAMRDMIESYARRLTELHG